MCEGPLGRVGALALALELVCGLPRPLLQTLDLAVLRLGLGLGLVSRLPLALDPLLLLLLARAFPASELPVLPRDHDAEGDAAAGARSDESGDEATRLV